VNLERAGPVSLIGGWEHTPGCEPIDEYVMEALGCPTPLVTVVPAASSERMVPIASERAEKYWYRMGGRVRVALPGVGKTDSVLEALEGADIIVLTGGQSAGIRSKLHGSQVWTRIVDLWSEGAAIAGSSMGLMELFKFRFKVWPPKSFSLVSGLGLLDGYVAVPHFDKYGLKWWSGYVAATLGDLAMLGLDERTALVGKDGLYTVVGSGSATIIRAGQRSVYPSGSTVTLKI
jgi:cyanophycinase-like exopeptidase